MEQGYQLAMPKNPDMQLQLEEYIINNVFLAEEIRNVYIGLHDRDEDGTFEWEDGEQLTWSLWADGRPNNRQGLQHCGVLWVGAYSPWATNESDCQMTWNDAGCSLAYIAVCEEGKSCCFIIFKEMSYGLI